MMDLIPMSNISLIYNSKYLFDLILMSNYKHMSYPMSKSMSDLSLLYDP